MARRKTVSINVDFIQPKIKSACRSYTVFCEMMGRPNQRTWVTEWNRGKNLPSPEEAVKMCEILSVEPEEILVKPEDIDLVRSLMDEKKPTQEGELDDATKELQDIWGGADQATREAILAAARMFKSRRT